MILNDKLQVIENKSLVKRGSTFYKIQKQLNTKLKTINKLLSIS